MTTVLKDRAGLETRPLTALRDPALAYPAAMLGLFVLAILLRIPTLSRPMLGYEEAGYAVDAWRLLRGDGDPGGYAAAAPGYVQLLGFALHVFGAGDAQARLLTILCGAGAVLLCAPLGRSLGRTRALIAALVLAVAPFWLRETVAVAPDAPAVFLAVLAAALTASRHLWPWSLIAAAGIAGYLLSFGAPGMWLAGGVIALLLYTTQRRSAAESRATMSRLRWAPAAIGVFVVAVLAGLSYFFTRPVRLSFGPNDGGEYATVASILRETLLSTPVYLLVLSGAALLLSARPRARAEVRRVSTPVILSTAVLALGFLGLLLPAAYRPTPAVLVLPMTFLAASWLVRALVALQPTATALWPAAAVVLLASAVVALSGLGRPPLVWVPGGAQPVARPVSTVRESFERVRGVSLELYSLDRTLEEPRGGRKLSVAVDPQLRNWGLWYLRDLQNVKVGEDATSTPEVRVLPAGTSTERAGYVEERPGGAQGLTLSWNETVWRRISPTAGSDAPAPRDMYGLFDNAPPGSKPGQLNAPSDIAIDPAGNYYVVDQANSRVQKFAPDGRYLLSWGTEGEGEGEFGDEGALLGPTGIAATREYVWVADTWNHRIQQFRPDGTFVRAWGEFADTKGEAEAARSQPRSFYGPRGIAIGPDRNLYITDTGNKRVVVYTQSGQYVRQWGTLGTGPAQLDEPVGIAVDRKGTVYVADARNSRVQVYTSAGRPLRRWRVDGWSDGRQEPYLDVDAVGNVYSTVPGAPAVNKYTPQGGEIASSEGEVDTPLLTPIGLAVTPAGEVYVVDSALGSVLHLESLR